MELAVECHLEVEKILNVKERKVSGCLLLTLTDHTHTSSINLLKAKGRREEEVSCYSPQHA